MKTQLGVLIFGLALAAPPAHAQSAAPHDQVFDLATIRAAHEVCGFDLSDEQLAVLDGREQALTDQDGIPPDEFSSVVAEVTSSLRRQVGEGICKANGAEAQLYRRKLAEYGLL